MGTLQDRELMNIDDVIQRQTNAYYQRKNIQNNRVPQTNTNANNTSSQDVIDLTQDDETNNFDTIPDDALLTMQIQESKNDSQKRRRIIKNPYKK